MDLGPKAEMREIRTSGLMSGIWKRDRLGHRARSRLYHFGGIELSAWHVERKSACIYSQLKTCSSSEVAAMIEGVLRHCTEMEIEKNYVDSHGQSEVAFAFCRLLGFH